MANSIELARNYSLNQRSLGAQRDGERRLAPARKALRAQARRERYDQSLALLEEERTQRILERTMKTLQSPEHATADLSAELRYLTARGLNPVICTVICNEETTHP